MASSLVDLVKINVSNSGTGAITLGSAVEGYRGRDVLTNGTVYSYSIQQGSAWEFGRGTYLAESAQFIRSVIDSSNGGAAIALKAGAQVAFTALSADLMPQVQLTAEIAADRTAAETAAGVATTAAGTATTKAGEAAASAGAAAGFAETAGLAVAAVRVPFGVEIYNGGSAILEGIYNGDYNAAANYTINRLTIVIEDATAGATVDVFVQVNGVDTHGPVTATFGTPSETTPSFSLPLGADDAYRIERITGTIRKMYVRADGVPS